MAISLGKSIYKLKLAILKRFCKIFIVNSRLFFRGRKTQTDLIFICSVLHKPRMAYVPYLNWTMCGKYVVNFRLLNNDDAKLCRHIHIACRHRSMKIPICSLFVRIQSFP